MRLSNLKVEVDLEAIKFIELEQANRKILVEIKSFTRTSIPPDFYSAQGKYDFYKYGVEKLELNHDVYLAISTVTYLRLNKQPAFLDYLTDRNIKVIIVDLNTENIDKWIE